MIQGFKFLCYLWYLMHLVDLNLLNAQLMLFEKKFVVIHVFFDSHFQVGG